MPNFPFALMVVLSVVALGVAVIVLAVRLIWLGQRVEQVEVTVQALTKEFRTLDTAVRNLITRKPSG
jgi:uncharacterized protein YoxC